MPNLIFPENYIFIQVAKKIVEIFFKDTKCYKKKTNFRKRHAI